MICFVSPPDKERGLPFFAAFFAFRTHVFGVSTDGEGMKQSPRALRVPISDRREWEMIRRATELLRDVWCADLRCAWRTPPEGDYPSTVRLSSASLGSPALLEVRLTDALRLVEDLEREYVSVVGVRGKTLLLQRNAPPRTKTAKQKAEMPYVQGAISVIVWRYARLLGKADYEFVA
jgi:hypothetical protein